MSSKKTLVGRIDPDVLAFTAGKDIELDRALVVADCVGTAAHVTMLSRLPALKRVFGPKERDQVITELVAIMDQAGGKGFRITAQDQDVHLAVERRLTATLGDLGKRVHTARSRNDQVALDLRLYGKTQLLDLMDEALDLAGVLLSIASRNEKVPMVGRTHLQPAMPSSVGVWASAYAESLFDDLVSLQSAFEVNDRCPLGSAAGYGVPLHIDRELTARLLGFDSPVHNVMHASNARGKCESVILSAAAQVMLTLSRLSADMVLYMMPEFGYFSLPAEYCTGSSIMPQKRNPDVFELIRARASRVVACYTGVASIINGLPGGYNRDLQEAKEPFLEGVAMTRQSVRVAALVMRHLTVNRKALTKAFRPDVFAADRALDLVVDGMPFRDAYAKVKDELDALASIDPAEAIAAKTHAGAPAGLDFALLKARAATYKGLVRDKRRCYHRAVSKLLGVKFSGC